MVGKTSWHFANSKRSGKPALPGPVSYLYTLCLFMTLGPGRSRPKSAENLSARLEAEELYPTLLAARTTSCFNSARLAGKHLAHTTLGLPGSSEYWKTW